MARNLSATAFPPAKEQLDSWFDTHSREWTNGAAYRFAVLHGEDVIGLADLDHVSPVDTKLAYWLGKTWWGKGFATEAAGALVEFAFGPLRLARLNSSHAEDNAPSGRVLQKLGFRHVGNAEVFSHSRNCSILSLRYVLDRQTKSSSCA